MIKPVETIKIAHLKYEIFHTPQKNFGVYTIKIHDKTADWVTQDFTNQNDYRKFLLDDLQKRVKKLDLIDTKKLIPKRRLDG